MTAQGGSFLTGLARRVDDQVWLGGKRAEGVHIDRPQRDVVGGAGVRLRRLDDPTHQALGKHGVEQRRCRCAQLVNRLGDALVDDDVVGCQ